MFKYKLYVKYVLDAVRCLNFRLIVVCLLFGRDRRFRTSNMAALIARSTVSSLTRRGIATSTLRCADKSETRAEFLSIFLSEWLPGASRHSAFVRRSL